VAREANILAFNDVFLVIGILSSLMFLWGVSIELRMRRRGETAPTALLAQKMAAMAADKPSQGQPA
ncbi:MAG TPA: MFS transporter, partial [Sphingomicrobium sp.]|nr:MFS transporter [Sphingomicrobium sp.]